MMWKVAEPRFDADPTLDTGARHPVHPPRRSRAELLDHGYAVVGSSHADPYSCTAAAAAALYGPRHGGANEMVIRMLTEIGSIENVPAFIESVKQGEGGRLQGFGHRVYKNYDPRAKIIKRTADEVFAVTGKNPLLDIALKLEEIALSDEYFTSRRLYPNVDFYSGPHLPGHGLPARDVPRALRHPPHRRLAGALAGAARPGLEDRPAPPALHRAPSPASTSPSPSAEQAPQVAPRVLGTRRIRPSWTIDTTRVPSRVKRKPRARPRAPKALGLSMS